MKTGNKRYNKFLEKRFLTSEAILKIFGDFINIQVKGVFVTTLLPLCYHFVTTLPPALCNHVTTYIASHVRQISKCFNLKYLTMFLKHLKYFFILFLYTSMCCLEVVTNSLFPALKRGGYKGGYKAVTQVVTDPLFQHQGGVVTKNEEILFFPAPQGVFAW